MAILTTAGMAFAAKRVFYIFVDHWKVVVPAVIVGVLLLWVITSYACGGPNAKLDQEEIRRAQEAVAKQDREAMVEILTKSDVEEQAIDANVAKGRVDRINAIYEARKKYAGKSNEELAAELEMRIEK